MDSWEIKLDLTTESMSTSGGKSIVQPSNTGYRSSMNWAVRKDPWCILSFFKEWSQTRSDPLISTDCRRRTCAHKEFSVSFMLLQAFRVKGGGIRRTLILWFPQVVVDGREPLLQSLLELCLHCRSACCSDPLAICFAFFNLSHQLLPCVWPRSSSVLLISLKFPRLCILSLCIMWRYVGLVFLHCCSFNTASTVSLNDVITSWP